MRAGILAIRATRIQTIRGTRDVEHRRQMPTRRTADRSDPFGIEMQTRRIRAQPPHGGFAIEDILRPRALARLGIGEQIVDAQANVAVLREGIPNIALTRRAFVAPGPTASVNDDDAGMIVCVVRRSVKVGFFRAIRRKIRDILFNSHARRFSSRCTARERQDQRDDASNERGEICGIHGRDDH